MKKEYLSVGDHIYYIKDDTKHKDIQRHFYLGCAPIVAIASNSALYTEDNVKFPIRDIDAATVYIHEDENGKTNYQLELLPYEIYPKFEDYILNLAVLVKNDGVRL